MIFLLKMRPKKRMLRFRGAGGNNYGNECPHRGRIFNPAVTMGTGL